MFLALSERLPRWVCDSGGGLCDELPRLQPPSMVAPTSVGIAGSSSVRPRWLCGGGFGDSRDELRGGL
eukprot:2005299-Alexandrium_andersonii.AAC.1